jgi:hypothetical protein
MRTLSKSKILAFRQCPKRLWLEVHKPTLREDSAATQASFHVGHEVGKIAHRLYDPKDNGILLDPQKDGFDAAFERTRQLLGSPQPIFEAGFQTSEALAFADVMLPVKKAGKLAWKMVEVKSSTEVKDYHLDDAAIQVFIARSTGVALVSASIACIDNQWVYPGGEDYAGLLAETDVTDQAYGREKEVKSWITDARRVVAGKREPRIGMGKHCNDPFECGFKAYCQSFVPAAAQPISHLRGRLSKPLQSLIETKGLTELRDIPDDLLNGRQRRVKTAALTGKPFFDKKGAARELEPYKLPAYFMDFETIQFAVPVWKGTRPYQQIPFQFSMHRLSRTGKLEHESFLDLSGADPSLGFARALLKACGDKGPVFAYNTSFEESRILELAARFPRLAAGLRALTERLVDLLPVARNHYYHPAQEGSWSIKAVLPSVISDLRYDDLEGIQDGGMAMEAFQEAIHPETTKARKTQIEDQLLRYCRLDTYAMVRLWQFFSGRSDLVLNHA